jgi:hypothetical protein
MADTEAAHTILEAWRATCGLVAATPATFLGRDKEARVFRELRDQISRVASGAGSLGPDLQVAHGSWFIDLVWCHGVERVAVEGKFKGLSDGAVPDNRKAAFFDLFKLEQCVDSGAYTSGIFLWLTNQPQYLQEASGDSAEFSTHEGRVYRSGTPLRATRSRNSMPLPLTLRRGYVFRWDGVSGGGWHSLVLHVGKATQPNH